MVRYLTLVASSLSVPKGSEEAIEVAMVVVGVVGGKVAGSEKAVEALLVVAFSMSIEFSGPGRTERGKAGWTSKDRMVVVRRVKGGGWF